MPEALSWRKSWDGNEAAIFFCIERRKKEAKFLVDSILFPTFASPFRDECCCSSVVEHFLGKEEVTSSSLVNSSENQEIANFAISFFVLFGVEKGAGEVVCGVLLHIMLHIKFRRPALFA